LIALDPQLVELADKQLNKIKHLSEEDQQQLIELISKAGRHDWINPSRHLFTEIFGYQGLQDLVEYGHQLTPINNKKIKIIKAKQFPEAAEKFYEDLCPQDFKENIELTVANSNQGFAEYWPISLTDKDKNQLIIYNNKFSKEQSVLRETIIHELAHAFFCKGLAERNLPWFDHGALVLIEGWATWVEWIGQGGPDAAALETLELLDIEREQVIDFAISWSKKHHRDQQQTIEQFLLNIQMRFFHIL
jgi:hypothetical protein